MEKRRLKLLNQLIDCLVAAKITARILMSDSEADAKIKGRYTRLYYNLIVQQLDGMVSALESFKYWTETVEQEPVPIRGYVCDPKKNKECAKTACYERGGLCCLTLNPEYAKEPSEKKETELDEYSHPGVMSYRHKEINTCVRVPKEEHTEMHRRKI